MCAAPRLLLRLSATRRQGGGHHTSGPYGHIDNIPPPLHRHAERVSIGGCDLVDVDERDDRRLRPGASRAREEVELDEEREAGDRRAGRGDESALAAAVPPVASTSSTMRTTSSAPNASEWTSSESVPYSRSYVTDVVSHGSLPGLRAGTKPAPSW